MSDLHQAVQAEIAAHTPALPPSFDTLKARKWARDRRRMAVAGAVLPVALVAFAVVVVPSLTGDGDRLAPNPGPAAGPLFVQEDHPPDATVVGTARLEGALIDPAHPAYLILSVAGAAQVPQDDPCWEGYRATLAEDGTKIVVEVERLQRVSANVGRSCLDVGATRAVGLTVGSPIGDRQVQDASSGATIRPFDGARLLFPSYLPRGYRETAEPGVGADGTWMRFYTGPANTSPITVKQELGEQLRPVEPRATIESRPTVSGRPATVYIVGDPGQVVRRTLQWTVDGQTVTVESGQFSPSVGPAAAEDLLRVAQGLGRESDEPEARAVVPADTADRFRSEAEVHGTVEAEQGCEATTSGEMLSAAQSRQDATGAPIDGWLVESPRDTRGYRCTYEGQFLDNAGRVAVWEAADADAGGPRPALDFYPR